MGKGSHLSENGKMDGMIKLIGFISMMAVMQQFVSMMTLKGHVNTFIKGRIHGNFHITKNIMKSDQMAGCIAGGQMTFHRLNVIVFE